MIESELFRIPIVIRGNSPFAKININGHELSFLVDSGAGLSVYDQKFIHYLGITEEQLGETISNISGVGENSFNGRLVMIFFKIDDMRFANLFTVSEMGATFRAFKDSIGDVAGILGGDFLNDYGAIIDYGTQEIRLDREKAESIMRETMARMKENKL